VKVPWKQDRALIDNVEKESAVVERLRYFRDEMFEGLYDPDPSFGLGL
jgi:hypothetical protein